MAGADASDEFDSRYGRDAGAHLIAVMGTTASGKTEFAEALSDHLNAQLINADAFQVYRGMDIGTAKSIHPERYLLLDLKNPDESYGVGEFVQLARKHLASLYAAGRDVVVVGGTGLYIRALFENYDDLADSPPDEVRAALMERERIEGLPSLSSELRALAPEVADRTDLANPARVRRALERLHSPSPRIPHHLPPFRKSKIAIDRDKNEVEATIRSRVHAMVQNGWLEEVERLRCSGYGPGDPGFRALGYSALWQHLAGSVALNDALEATVLETRRYAKRQRSWLRSEPNTVKISGADVSDMISHVIGQLIS